MNPADNSGPTPYPDVNLTLHSLLENLRAVLDDYFTGMYLYGSLALGDFDPGRSDIDFLVVTTRILPEKLVLNLKRMHSRLYNSGLQWMKMLSGAYIPVAQMWQYSQNSPACPLVNRGEFVVACQDIDWVIHRYILYSCGLVITGPTLQSMIYPVSPEALKEASLKLLRNNWAVWAENAGLFNGPGYQPFVVLTMCRALHTIKYGEVVSKQISAKWLMTNSDRKWNKLIEKALLWRYGDPAGDVELTQQFMKYVFKEAGVNIN